MFLVIRELLNDEVYLLRSFLYDAIFIPEGTSPPDKSIIETPELQVYIQDFGSMKSDKCLVAEVNGEVVGAVWCRIMNDYGHIDDETPSLAISVRKEYRGRKIGTELMRAMLEALKQSGYSRVSLSVQKANYAVKMYIDLGFDVFSENDGEYIMRITLT
ncbi:MAG: GNAT family N-acetyltransferase [Synergistaceae bacterium]|nr:GNAT family N-acetyltransferase [Synergistaceae bacterium]